MKTQTPTKRTAHRLATVLAIITALATTGAWAAKTWSGNGADSYWSTSGNWSGNGSGHIWFNSNISGTWKRLATINENTTETLTTMHVQVGSEEDPFVFQNNATMKIPDTTNIGTAENSAGAIFRGGTFNGKDLNLAGASTTAYLLLDGTTLNLSGKASLTSGKIVCDNSDWKLSGDLIIGAEADASVTFTLNSGTVTVANNRWTKSTNGHGTLNLNGGTLVTQHIEDELAGGSLAVNFNGGTIKANKAHLKGLISHGSGAGLDVTVGANGGTIDASGYNVTISADLDNAAGATGAMTFKGGGTVTLSGAISYTGGTTVEAGTVVIVPDVAKRTALGAITVAGLENNICEVVRLSGEGTFSAGDLPANTETVTFAVSPDGKSILAANGLESPFWIGGSGDLGTSSNWSGGAVPTENPTIKWASPITLTNSGNFAPNTLTIPDDSAVVTLAGALTVNCLTNASKLAVASTGSLTVTGDLVGTTDVGYGWGILLYSNEGTVTANRVVGYATVDHTRFNEYESVTANTTPICAKGIVYKNMPSPAQLMHMYLAEARDGLWVVGEDGFTFENSRQSDYTTFAVGNTDNSVVATLFSSADWMLRNSGRPNSWNGDIWVAKNGALVIDTSDYADSSIGHTITLNGRIRTTSDASASAVTIKGCGTVVVNTTGSNSGLTVEEQNTYIASGKTLSVTNSAMLQVNVDKKILGEGTISLAAGTTLALPSNADRTFTTPDIVPVTLPAEGTATIKIDGGKLRNDVDYVLLNSVPAGYAEHLVVTGTALDGRHYRLADDGEGHLVMNVVSPGTVIYIR